ncbi:tRNA lysidine(34) synthetase TilS [Schaalia sp. 19OD2882]|uniref:tRNA lysidine(34) synthetase TilS n=1 Tax=Schaalia sp. 19OD2882 TaxID=2794089 RepID=UPI001C1EE114|nr:tRNA lysidine(34) synthetase TilS [Schaalia sp. 19OD2882]QWW19858.1 tRNA lysidine(34) synthetase TilS [Schaalia sp. 19OD2882]
MPGDEGERRPRACDLVGANPSGVLSRLDLAVRRALLPFRSDGARDLLVGLSGGADSMALALAAIDVGARLGMRVHCLTVDHALRDGSAEEAALVIEWARHLGAQADGVRVRPGREGGPEGAARAARRRALSERARQIGRAGSGHPDCGRGGAGPAVAVPILLGHTADDQAETVLLRLARGSGARSLRAMSPCVVDEDGTVWLRPLLDLRRADLREVLVTLSLPWVEDPTNAADGPWRAADGSPLRRAAVREKVLPALAEALGVDPVPALARTARLLARDDDALDARAADLRRAATGQNPQVLVLEELIGAPDALLTRVLRDHLLANGARAGDLASTHLARACDLVTRWSGQGPLQLPGVELRRERDATGAAVLVARAPRPR